MPADPTGRASSQPRFDPVLPDQTQMVAPSAVPAGTFFRERPMVHRMEYVHVQFLDLQVGRERIELPVPKQLVYSQPGPPGPSDPCLPGAALAGREGVLTTPGESDPCRIRTGDLQIENLTS